jgi:arginase
MSISLIVVPYSLGHHNTGTGAGPSLLIEAGVDDLLVQEGFDVLVDTVEYVAPAPHEIAGVVEINNLLAEKVRKADEGGSLPIVLAGNCSHCIGTLAGLDPNGIGVIWFDAHGDFHTPDTSTSGFFDGMCLNMATGGSWIGLAGTIPGFDAVRQNNVILVGVRDLDPAEVDLLEASTVTVCNHEKIRERGIQDTLERDLAVLAARTKKVYVHVDLDVLDPELAPANEFSPPGGLTQAELHEALDLIAERFDVRAAALASYNPEVDAFGEALAAAKDVVKWLARMGGVRGDRV